MTFTSLIAASVASLVLTAAAQPVGDFSDPLVSLEDTVVVMGTIHLPVGAPSGQPISMPVPPDAGTFSQGWSTGWVPESPITFVEESKLENIPEPAVTLLVGLALLVLLLFRHRLA